MYPVLAALDVTSTVSYSQFSDVISAISAELNVGTVVAVLTAAIPVCIGLVFMWWGVRKVSRMLMGAFKKGRLRL